MRKILEPIHLKLSKEPGMDGYQIVLLNTKMMPFLQAYNSLYAVYVGPYLESLNVKITNRLKLSESLKKKDYITVAEDTIDLAKNFAKLR